MNPKSKIAVVLFVIGLGIMSATSVQAQSDAQTKPYTSTWEDFKTVVPDGWATLFDSEDSKFTDITFKSSEPYYSLSIRCYAPLGGKASPEGQDVSYNYNHKFSDGGAEFYTGYNDYIKQISQGLYFGDLIEPVHDLELGGLKAKQFVARAQVYSRPFWQNKYGLVDKDFPYSPGEHAYTVVKSPSGFYVLIYFAPQGGYEKYRKLYDQMVASFELIKDGPGGAPLPGKIAVEVRSDEVLKQLVSQFQSQKDILFGPPVTRTDWSTGDPVVKGTISGWFADASVKQEKKIIEFVSAMKSAPAIPDEATRDFVKATTYMKDAKDVSYYQFAVDAFEKALFNAPWWGDAYYNLGIAFEAAGRYDDAMESMKLYLLTNPATAAEDKKRIYAIEAKQEKAMKAEAAMRSKYGANDGSSGFNFDSLFRYGAIVQDMSFDASGNARTVSLKISTRKENGRLVNYLTIFDITSKEDTFGQKFSADWRGEQTFFLDDRSSPGKESMTMTVTSFGDGDAKISIRPSDNASASIQTTLADLLRERARQAVYAGGEIKIGEKTFCTIGQGGAKGSLLFFPVEIKDKLEHGEVRDLAPMFVAIVSYRGSSGENESFTQSDLGVIDGTHYYLEHEGGSWVSKIGQGPDN